jgi:hypothetical protein
MPSVTPAFWSDSFRRGADYSEVFVLRTGSANGPVVDLTGSVVTITVRRRFAADVVYGTVSTPTKLAHGGAAGTITWTLTEADTAGYGAGSYPIEVKVLFQDGTTNVYIDGVIAAEG